MNNNSITASTLNSAKQLREEIKQDAMATARLMDNLDKGLARAQSTLNQARSTDYKALPSSEASIPFAPVKRRMTKDWLNKLYTNHKPYFEKHSKESLTLKGYQSPTMQTGFQVRIDVANCWTEYIFHRPRNYWHFGERKVPPHYPLQNNEHLLSFSSYN